MTSEYTRGQRLKAKPAIGTVTPRNNMANRSQAAHRRLKALRLLDQPGQCRHRCSPRRDVTLPGQKRRRHLSIRSSPHRRPAVAPGSVHLSAPIGPDLQRSWPPFHRPRQHPLSNEQPITRHDCLKTDFIKHAIAMPDSRTRYPREDRRHLAARVTLGVGFQILDRRNLDRNGHIRSNRFHFTKPNQMQRRD